MRLQYQKNTPGIEYHWCKYLEDSKNNLIENGFTMVVIDQDGVKYVLPKEYIEMDYTGREFLIVTKFKKENITQWYEITDNGLKQQMNWKVLAPREINSYPGLY